MVKLGFIVEGATEKIILESDRFKQFLKSISIDFVNEVIDAGGNGNLLPHNIIPFTKVLEDRGANKIIILTDLDYDQCITKTKERIQPQTNHIVVVSVKQIEAWFLSDTEALRKFLNDPIIEINNPELIADPFNEIKSLRFSRTGRGVSDKKILAKQMLKNDFSILNASKHNACSSAKYFLHQLYKSVNTN